MSVLIKGMQMPEKCGLCDLFHAESPMHCTVVKGHKTVGAPYGMPRPDWCPLMEVKHGKNVGTDYDEVDQFVCSECGIELQGWYRVERDEDDGEETYHEYRLRYCPNCGARMDKE